MLKMSQVNDIREMEQSGYRKSEIAKKIGCDIKTVTKYIEKEDFSGKIPVSKHQPSKLDPYKVQIQEWLDEDRKHWHKQRHTAKRIHDRLVTECGFTGSYNLVQRYVKGIREETIRRATQELVWEPGTAQMDFGETDVYEDGECKRRKFLVLSFPYSNDGYAQLFGGETAECVCQGLKDIFEYIGGVPPVIVFDNATGIGRRVRDEIHESGLFGRFRAHYRFKARFCNPASGWEKGNVERKVGYIRSNLFVPVPHIHTMADDNPGLLRQHEAKASQLHYKKEVPIGILHEEDRKNLIPLPAKAFNVCRYEWLKADGYGKVTVDGKHHYSTRPENSRKDVLVGIRAHRVDILTEEGALLASHPREFGDKRTDTCDYRTALAALMKNAGAWSNSPVRRQVPEILRTYMDGLPKKELRKSLKTMEVLNRQYGFEAALSAMTMAAKRGQVNLCDAAILAARITGYGIHTPPEAGPPLSVYDALLHPTGQEAQL